MIGNFYQQMNWNLDNRYKKLIYPGETDIKVIEAFFETYVLTLSYIFNHLQVKHSIPAPSSIV
jgi:hypothetical protein